MNMWIAVILAVLAIALAAFALFKIYGALPMSHITGLEALNTLVTAVNVKATTNAANIAAVNKQLGVVAVATENFTTLADAEVTPAFPITLS
jgi:hypothetical protein